MTHETTPITHVVTKPSTSGELREQAYAAIAEKTIPYASIIPEAKQHDRNSFSETTFFRITETPHAETAGGPEEMSGIVVDTEELVRTGIANATNITLRFILDQDSSQPATAVMTRE